MAHKSKKKKWTNGGSGSKENFVKLYVIEMINVIVNDKSVNDRYAEFYSHNIKYILDLCELQLKKNNGRLYDILLDVLNWKKIASIISIEIGTFIKNDCLATFAINHIDQNYDIWYRYLKNLNNDMNNEIIYDIIAKNVDQSLEFAEFLSSKQRYANKHGGDGMFSKFKSVLKKSTVYHRKPSKDVLQLDEKDKNTILQENSEYATNVFSAPYETIQIVPQTKYEHIVQIITNIILIILEEIKDLTGKDIIDIVWSNKNIKKIFNEKHYIICKYIYISTVINLYRTDKNLPLIIKFIKNNNEVILDLCSWITDNDKLFKKLVCKILKDELNLMKAISLFFNNISASTSMAPIGIKLKRALDENPELLKMFEKNAQYYFSESCPYTLRNLSDSRDYTFR